MPQGRPICVLISGGVDSAVLLHRSLSRDGTVLPLYLRCGLRWESAELYWLHRLLRAMRTSRLQPLCVIDAPLRAVYGVHWSVQGRSVPSAGSADAAVYLPGRNVLLASYAALICAERKMSTIALGILNGNPFSDASPQFFRQLAGCLSRALQRPIRLITPLRRFQKAEVLQMARGVPLQLTFSCLRPAGYRPCGRCNKCAERAQAFRAAGLPDPTKYVRSS